MKTNKVKQVEHMYLPYIAIGEPVMYISIYLNPDDTDIESASPHPLFYLYYIVLLVVFYCSEVGPNRACVLGVLVVIKRRQPLLVNSNGI